MPTVFLTKTNCFKSANTQWLVTEHQQLLCGSNVIPELFNGSCQARPTKMPIKMPQFLRPGHIDMDSHTHVFSSPLGNDTEGTNATLSRLLRREKHSTIFSRTPHWFKEIQNSNWKLPVK